MSRRRNELLIAQGGVQIPASAAAGKIATSDASGNIGWSTVASLQGTSSTTFAAGDATEYAFSAWKDLGLDRLGVIQGNVVAQTQLLNPNGPIALNSSASAIAAFRLDPAWYAAGSRTVKVRVLAAGFVNAVAPACNFTFTLAAVNTFGGASGVRTMVVNLKTALCTVTQNTPGASSQFNVQSAAATLTADYYVLTVANSATTAVSSDVEFRVSAQYQQV